MIRDCNIQDAHRIAEIYNYYIKNTVISFEEELVTPEIISQRITDIKKRYPWIVFEDDEKVIGYAYASPWKSRSAYRHSVESTVYLDSGCVGKGIGKRLYNALIQRLMDLPVHSIIGGIALPNDASVALHEKLGFEKVAHFKDVGLKFGKWVDVGYWELVLPQKDG